MRVASALGNPVLRRGPAYVARAAALLAGVALPLVLRQVAGAGPDALGGSSLAAILVAALLVRLHGRIEGWRVALGTLAVLAIYSVARS